MPDHDSTSPLQSLSDGLAELVTRAAPALVAVQSHRSRASGFVWRPGLIVTADEALAEDGAVAVVLPGGQTVAATVAGRDPTTDVALLRIDQPALAPVTLVPASVRAGALALVVGARDGGPCAALGMVALAGAAWRSLRGGAIDARVELSVSVRRSSEGGLVLDAAGRAIGMAVFGPRRRVLVIPSATIERVAAKLASDGRIARGYLGLALQPVKLDDARVGAMVMGVAEAGPGAASGIHQGDVIVAWDGQPIRSVQTLLAALGPDSVGTVVRLSLKRAGEPAEASLTIGERPEA
jgi:S1-C subfamily serine protease